MNRIMPAAIILSAGLGILVGFSFRNRNLHGDLTPIPRGPDEGQETTGSPTNTPPNGEWPSWTSQTPLEVIAKLRAAGCPDRYVEDIVIAEINKKTAQMLMAHQTYGLSLPISAQTRVSQIRSNRLSELAHLLGPKVTETDALIGLPYIDPEAQITGPQRIVADVLRRKASMLSDIQAVTHGFITREDRKSMAAVEQEAEIEIQRALGPEEYRRYRINQLRESDFGRELVTNFGATDDELPAIDKYMQSRAQLDAAPNKDAAQEQNNEVLKMQLGIPRYNQFKSFLDPEHRDTAAFAKRFGFDPAVVDEIVGLRNAAMETRRSIYNARLDAADAVQFVDRGTQAARDRLNQILGANAAEIFAREAKMGNWFR